MPIGTHAGAGIQAGKAYTHDIPDDWKSGRPPAPLLSDAMNAAWGEYAEILQRARQLDADRRHLYDETRDREALEADERAAAALPLDATVTTPNLDKLAADRRAILVASGGAARAADAALDRMRALRQTPDALNPAGRAAAIKARDRAAKLAAELMPLLETVTAWPAAVRWTEEQPYRPAGDLVQSARHIADTLTLLEDFNA